MKKLILIVSLAAVGVLFSGCCHLWFGPCSPNIGPGPVVVHPGGHGR